MILERHPVKSKPDRKKVSKGGNETDAETLDIRLPKVIGWDKKEHCLRT